MPTDTVHLCHGDTLQLNSWKTDYLIEDNFNDSVLGNIWTSNINPLWTNPCEPITLPASGIVLWFGYNSQPRELSTCNLDISCYNTSYVEFDMKYAGNQANTGDDDCESPDLPDEGVHLSYSINGGVTWTQFPGTDSSSTGTYGTPGYVNGSGGYWTPVQGNAATGPYYSWNHYKCKIPAAGISANTKIKWSQTLTSGYDYDHWGIDNVKISCPTIPFLEWRCAEYNWTGFEFNPPSFIIDQPAGVYHYIVSMVDYNNNNICNEQDTVVVIVDNLAPSNAGAISGISTVCEGQDSIIYKVPPIANATSYIWTLPSGANGTSNCDSIIVNYSISAVSGNIVVKGNNSCGNGNSSVLAITVNNIPVTPIITQNGNALHSNATSGNQWYNQLGLINGAIYQDYTPLINNEYYVIVTNNDCSSEQSNTISITNVDINIFENNNSIKVYPNPILNELIIEIEDNKANTNYEVLNSIGKVIYKGNFIGKTKVQTSKFASGVYTIKIINGNYIEYRKIIKE